MIRKIAIVGVTCAAVVGTGATALAATGNSSGSGQPAPSSRTAAHHAGPGKHGAKMRRLIHRFGVHGEIVTTDKSGNFTTREGIVGTVSDVSSTAITVKAADDYTLTFAIGDSTKVRVRANGSGNAGSIGDVHDGDSVAVMGKHAGSGSGEPTATVIVDGIKR